MSDCNYGSIPMSEDNAVAPIDGGTPPPKRSALTVALATIFVAGVFGAVLRQRFGTAIYPSGVTGVESSRAALVGLNSAAYPSHDVYGPNFPTTLMKIGGEPKKGIWPNNFPTNTKDAKYADWIKSDKTCNEVLGEEWLYNGERSNETSATVYFTPEVGNTPGVLTAIEVDYYNYKVPEPLTDYFSGPYKNLNGEEYHSVAVLLRDPAKNQGVCENVTEDLYQPDPYVLIAPGEGMANKIAPIQEPKSAKELQDWKEGACIHNMGRHWASDVVGGNDLSGKIETLVPVLPMYSCHDNTINGIFFLSDGKKQNDPACDPPFSDSGQPLPCFVRGLNFWDAVPLSLNNTIGLDYETIGSAIFCTNFCGNCQFASDDKSSGFVSTMHFFFKNTFGENQCKKERDRFGSCRNETRDYLTPEVRKLYNITAI